jgi:NDP-sugar pyrophosphorylase family protein
MIPVAILAGGLATRLWPMTQKIPKSMINIAGVPFIDHQLRYLSAQGVSQVVICAGFLGEVIQAYVGGGSRYSLDVQYSFDGEQLLGTGGSLKKALNKLGSDFFILYGDSFLPIDFLAVEQVYFKCQKKALMTVFRNKNQWDKSNVYYKNGAIIEYDKINLKPEMNYIDYGLGVMSKKSFEPYSCGSKFDLGHVYHNLSLKDELFGYEVFERFYEIGSESGIEETNFFLGQKN